MSAKSSEPTASYAAAIARLNEIVLQIEDTQIDVDDLEAAVKEAVALITLCRSRLTGAQTAVEQALQGLKGDSVAPEEED